MMSHRHLSLHEFQEGERQRLRVFLCYPVRGCGYPSEAITGRFLVADHQMRCRRRRLRIRLNTSLRYHAEPSTKLASITSSAPILMTPDFPADGFASGFCPGE